jgi:hypothetical protein
MFIEDEHWEVHTVSSAQDCSYDFSHGCCQANSTVATYPILRLCSDVCAPRNCRRSLHGIWELLHHITAISESVIYLLGLCFIYNTLRSIVRV